MLNTIKTFLFPIAMAVALILGVFWLLEALVSELNPYSPTLGIQQKEEACRHMSENICFILQGCAETFPSMEACQMVMREEEYCLKAPLSDIETCNKHLLKMTCSVVPGENDPCLKLME